MGQNAYVVGSASGIAGWDIKQAHKLSTKKDLYPAWESKTPATIETKGECANLEYKYIIMDDKSKTNPNWEGGNNHRVDLSQYFDRAVQGN